MNIYIYIRLFERIEKPIGIGSLRGAQQFHEEDRREH